MIQTTPFHLTPAPDEIGSILEFQPALMVSLTLAANAGHEAGLIDRCGKIVTME